MILVDSSVWIDYFKGAVTAQTEKLHQMLGHEPLAIGDLMLFRRNMQRNAGLAAESTAYFQSVCD